MSVNMNPGYTLALLAFAGAAFAQAPQVARVTPVGVQMTAPAPATAAPLPVDAPAIAPDSRAETLGPGDMVRINVFRNPDLLTETRVSERGAIAFPLIGELVVTGLTPTQLSARIAEKLRNGKFVVNPEVTTSIAQVNSRQVSVLGNVNKPGRYPLDASTGKLTDLLALAGGVSPTGADTVTIISTREGRTTQTEVDLPAMIRSADLGKNVELQPNDTVFVNRAPMIYIYGEVQKAGAYRVEPHMTVMQALALGGGLTVRGTERGVRIHRRGKDGNVRQLDARLTDEVRTDDVIYVRESLF